MLELESLGLDHFERLVNRRSIAPERSVRREDAKNYPDDIELSVKQRFFEFSSAHATRDQLKMLAAKCP